jgi:hypothetical protein
VRINSLTRVTRDPMVYHCMKLACLLSMSWLAGSWPSAVSISIVQVHESLRRHQTSIQCRAAQADRPSKLSNAAVPTHLGSTPLPPPPPPPPPPPQQQQQRHVGSAPAPAQDCGGVGRQTRSRAALPKAAAAGELPPACCCTCPSCHRDWAWQSLVSCGNISLELVAVVLTHCLT